MVLSAQRPGVGFYKPDYFKFFYLFLPCSFQVLFRIIY